MNNEKWISFFKNHALRTLWSALACGALLLCAWACDVSSALGLGMFIPGADAAQTTYHFAFRIFFWCVDYLILAGLFLPSLGSSVRERRLLSLVRSLDFWIWIAFFFLAVLAVPADLGLSSGMPGQLYPDSFLWKLFLMAFYLLGGVWVCLSGGGMEQGERKHHPTVLLGLFLLKCVGLVFMLALAAYVLPAVCVALAQLGRIALMIPPAVLLHFALAVFLFFAILIFGRYRRLSRFFKRLQRLCRQKGYVLTNQKVGISCFLFARFYCGFDLEAEGRVFSCRLRGFLCPLIPVIFDKKEKGFRLFTLSFAGAKILSLKKKFDFSVDGEGEKVFLLCPCPKALFVTKPNGELSVADNGEIPPETDVTVYSSEAFFNMVDRSVFSVKPSKTFR